MLAVKLLILFFVFTQIRGFSRKFLKVENCSYSQEFYNVEKCEIENNQFLYHYQLIKVLKSVMVRTIGKWRSMFKIASCTH